MIGRTNAGGGGADTSIVTAEASDILLNKVIVDANGNPLTGTMPNNGSVSSTLNAGGSYTIPAGYHNGSGKVTANSLASQTSATATATQILTGQTAYVNGSKITGTMANQGTKTTTLNAGGSYTIPAGYHNGSGKVTANSLSSQTSATATASDIVSGKTAWVNGTKLTGTFSGKKFATGSFSIKGFFVNGDSMIYTGLKDISPVFIAVIIDGTITLFYYDYTNLIENTLLPNSHIKFNQGICLNSICPIAYFSSDYRVSGNIGLNFDSTTGAITLIAGITNSPANELRLDAEGNFLWYVVY